ncbi:MAG: hypothetical protein QXK47_02275 [Candidatus Bathyarchaeia archaeon]
MQGKTLIVKSLIIAALSITVSLAVGLSLYYAAKQLYSTGRIVTVGLEAFQDQNCTLPLTEINWGTVTINSAYNFTCYLKSTSNMPANLTMYVDDFQPVNASQILTLTWDAENSILKAGEVKKVTFTLTVGSEHYNVTDFSFTIHLIGTVG